MNILTITCVTDITNPGFIKLKNSLDKFKYDYAVIHDPALNFSWGGLVHLYEFCKKPGNVTHILATDGFDTLALGGIEEVYERYTYTNKMLFSAEKGCFPRGDWTNRHMVSVPTFNGDEMPQEGKRLVGTSRWRYLNHGQFITPCELFVELYKGVFELPVICQEWAMDQFLNGAPMELDTNCDIFQSIAFRDGDEYSSEGDRLVNNITGTKPTWAHANGKSEFDWVYEISER